MVVCGKGCFFVNETLFIIAFKKVTNLIYAQATLVQREKSQRLLKNHLNPVMLVFFG